MRAGQVLACFSGKGVTLTFSVEGVFVVYSQAVIVMGGWGRGGRGGERGGAALKHLWTPSNPTSGSPSNPT